MDWRALLQNQWLQLCLLVAVLSSGTMVFDLGTGRFGGGHSQNATPTPAPGPTAAPTVAQQPSATPIQTPVVKLKAKNKGHWIVDAAGASDSDSRDLRAVAANLADGDLVTVRPGSYQAGIVLNKNVHLVGQGDASLHSTYGDTVQVTGQHAVIEHLTIGFDAPGDQFTALRVVGNSQVDLNACVVGCKGKFDAFVEGNASLTAGDTKFQTLGGGCALKYQNSTHGKLDRCEFSFNNWGLEAVNAAQIDLRACTFARNGLPTGAGNIMFVEGGQAAIRAELCTFVNNTATIAASEGGTLALNGCTFRDNGVTGESGNSNDGLVSSQTGAKVTMNNDTFQMNKQGITVLSGGKMEINQVRMSGTGIQTENDTLKYYARAVYAAAPGSSVSIAGSTIADSVSDGMLVLDAASLDMRDSTVTNSTANGLVLGYVNLPPSHAELNNAHFLGNHTDGVWVSAASSINAQNCEFSDNGYNGVEINDLNSQARIVNSVCRNNKDTGLFAYASATLTASGCTLEGNARGAEAGFGNDAQRPGTVELDNCFIRGNSVFGVGACLQSTLELRGGFLGGQKQNVYREASGVVRQLR